MNTDGSVLYLRVTPVITDQPSNVTATVGGRARFVVAVAGLEPLAYQWRFNENPIPEATSSVYTIEDVQSGHAWTGGLPPRRPPRASIGWSVRRISRPGYASARFPCLEKRFANSICSKGPGRVGSIAWPLLLDAPPCGRPGLGTSGSLRG